MGYFEKISAGAISNAMPQCKGIIINVGNQKHITDNLNNMFFQNPHKFFVTETNWEKLPKVLNRCKDCGIPTIVNCGNTLPDISNILTNNNISNVSCICPGTYTSKENIIQTILDSKKIINASFLAYQSYYFSPDKIIAINNKFFEHLRLGQLRENISLCEPLLRNSEYVFIDVNSVRYSDFPSNTYHNPNGLYAEEMCQIARYVGFGQRLKTVFIYGEPKEEDNSLVSNKLSTEILWHICNGLSSNHIENPSTKRDKKFVKKYVQLDENGESITFINSLLSDRWWMEIPTSNNSLLIPCSIDEYRIACKGEIPIRWLFFYQKYTIL